MAKLALGAGVLVARGALIVSFIVMVRPLKAINLLRERMAAALQAAD